MDDREQWEQRIESELKRLPDLSAPETLVHRVMLGVHARARVPWWRRSWGEQSNTARMALFLLLLAASASVIHALEALVPGVDLSGVWVQARQELEVVRPVWEILVVLAKAATVVFQRVGQPLLWLAAGLVLTFYLVGVGLTTACYRLAARRS